MNAIKTAQTFLEAYLELQKGLNPISKDAKAHNYKYATLGAVKEAVDSSLYDSGFVIKQRTELDNDCTRLITDLVHVATGEMITSAWSIKPVKDDPQGMGSALTYARRYQYMVVCNLVAEDDDGAGASSRVEVAQAVTKSQYSTTLKTLATDKQIVKIAIMLKEKGRTDQELCKHYNVTSKKELTISQASTIIENLGKLEDVKKLEEITEEDYPNI